MTIQYHEGKPVAFHYDRSDFFYIGAFWADLCHITGEPQLPGFSTWDPPPSEEREGDAIAVYDPIARQWEMRTNNFWTPRRVELTPVFGNTMDGTLEIKQYQFVDLNRFPGIPRVLNPVKHAMALSGRLAYMQKRLEEIVQADAAFRAGSLMDMGGHFYAKFAVEDLVLNMKRVVDEVFMNEWVRLEGRSDQFLNTHKIEVPDVKSIDKLTNGDPTKDHLLSMRNADPLFFETLTNLRNSYAHHYSVCESYDLYGQDRPTVNTLYIHRADLSEIRLIQVWLEDLVKSFNRFLIRTFG